MTDPTLDLTEQHAPIRDISLNYRCFGKPTDPALLLIMGLATQRTAWPQAWIDAFVNSGRYVITYDHRDIGLSTRMQGAQAPNPVKVFMRRRLKLKNDLAYSLKDLAMDALALLDYLNIETAEVLGISMGGMVAQWLAILAPTRVRKLTLLMTSSGYPLLPTPSWKVLKLFLQSAPSRQNGAAPLDPRELAAAYLVNLFTLIGSPAFPTDRARRTLWAKAQVQRSIAGLGAVRQLAAICDDAERYRQLARISAPTRIFHGTADLLVPIAHGRDLAKRIGGAQFTEVAGLGHDLPEQLAEYFASKL